MLLICIRGDLMESYEDLINTAENDNVSVVDYYFNSKRINGLYSDGTIAVSNDIISNEKKCVLAEELGHYHTSNGDIIDQKDIVSIKQENHARGWAYDKLIGIDGIIDCYTSGCRTIYDMAEQLEVTENFFMEAIPITVRNTDCVKEQKTTLSILSRIYACSNSYKFKREGEYLWGFFKVF